METSDEWNQIHLKDLWVYNKLNLSRVLGYACGPAGARVPKPSFYMVRPSMNLNGMSQHAKKMFLYDHTNHLYPSDFWCEYFEGHHISVDYHEKKPILTVIGSRDREDLFYKWTRWLKLDEYTIEFPEILNDLSGNYPYINCEFIGERLIEVHFRQNPNFQYNNRIAVPVWKEDTNDSLRYIREGYRWIDAPSYERLGFYIK